MFSACSKTTKEITSINTRYAIDMDMVERRVIHPAKVEISTASENAASVVVAILTGESQMNDLRSKEGLYG